MIPRDKRLGRYGIITLSASLLVSLVAVAGSLTPPGVPASTMRTLQEIYDTVAGTFDSSAISSDPDGSVIQGLKYITENLSWSLSGSDIYNNNVGNVGIGTTAPLTKLDIIGDVLVRALPPTLGAPVFFTHANFSSDEDAIDASVHLTRGTSGPLYNALTEGSSDYDTSPENTEWNADGFSNIGDLRTRTYGAFGPVVFNAFGSLQFIVGKELVMHIISSDTYYKVVFSQWTNGAAGGGFEYTRTQVIFTDGSNVRIGTQDASGTLEIVGRASISGVALAGTFTSPGTGADSEKFGLNAVADSIGSIAIGNNARALSGGFGSGTNSLVIGASAIVSNQASVVIGAFASDSMATIAGENVIIGAEALMTGGAYYGTIIGKSASGSEEGPTAIGYFAEAVGDSIAIGRNASSRKSTIAIGIGARTTAAGQMVIGDQGDGVDGPISDVYIGRGVTATSPQNVTINSTGGNGTDIAGGDLTFAGGKPTGAGDGGNIIFSTAQAGSSGTTLRSLNERMRIDQFGNVGIGTTDPSLYKVQIATSGTSNQSMLAAYDADSIVFDVFTSSTDGVARVINGSATPRVQLHSNGNSYFMGGNVGIGTTAPETDFELVGTASISAITGSAFTGISNCNLESQTLNWDSSTGRFSCLADGTGGGGVASDSLDFDEFVDAMTLDANTTITGGLFALTFDHASVSGDFEIGGNITSGTSISGNFDPTLDNTYDLGNTAFRWKSVNVGPGSFNITSTTGTAGAGANHTLGQISFPSGSSLSLGTQAVGTGNAGSLELRTANTARLFVSSGGNVGVGTTSPFTQLHVPGKLPTAAAGSVATGTGPQGLFVQGRYAYVANYSDDTFRIFDVSDPASPVQLSSTATDDEVNYVTVHGRYAYVTSYGATGMLRIWDISNPSAPVSVGSVAVGFKSYTHYVQGRYAYVANAEGNSLRIFDISNPAAPVFVGQIATGGTTVGVFVQDQYAYVTVYSTNTLKIIDISNPASPIEVGSVATGSLPGFIYAQGRYVYVANSGGSSVQIFDVSNPASPVSVSTITTGSGPTGVYIQGRYAYVANSSSNTLQILDVSNPASPTSVGTVATGTSPRGVIVQGRYAYLINNGSNTLQSFDVGGSYIQQFETGGIDTSTLTVRNALSAVDGTFSGGLTVSGGLKLSNAAGIDYRQLYSTAVTTPSVSQSALSVDRQLTTNSSFASTLTVSGALASITDNATQTTGTITSTTDVLQINQKYASNSGAALNVTTAGTGLALRINDDGTFTDSTPFVVNASGSVGIGTSAPGSKLDVSGNIAAGDGTVSSPSYSFIGDRDTGMWKSAANTLNFSTAALERMRIDSSGNVGVGDISPTALFVVGSGDLFRVNSSGRVLADVGASGAGNLAYSFVGDTDTGLYNSAADEMRFQTAGTDKVTITSAGNVGIGTTTVGAKLAVEGNLLFTAATPTISPSTAGTSLSIDSNGTGALNLNNTATGDIVMAGGVGATGCTLTNSTGAFSCSGNITTTGIGTPTAGFWTRDTASGFLYPSTIGDNVGIGTSTGLTHKLKVEGSIFASTQATAVNEVVTAGRTISPGTGMSGGGALTGDLTLSSTTWSSSSSHIISLGAGNVGVGTGVVTPGSKLQVNGNTALGYAGATTGPALGLTVSGNVGIGTIAPTEKLEVVGNILASGNITTLTGTVSGASLSGTCNLAGSVSDPGGAGTWSVSFSDTNCADYAEVYHSSEPVNPGDLLVFDTANPGKVKKASQGNSANIMGIVSTSPAAIVGNGKFISGKMASEYDNPSQPAVALIGRVPTKVSLENGPIAAGDRLTASSIPGVAMKATEGGMTVGVAMEHLNNTASASHATVLTFVNVGYWAPSVADVVGDSIEVSSGGGISDTDTIFSAIIYKFKETLEIVFEKGLIRVAKIITDILETKKLVADELQLKDSQTGEIYCVTIKNGEWNKAEGECGIQAMPTSISNPTPDPFNTASGSFESTAPSLPDSSGSSDTPSIIPVPVDNFESSPSPSPTIESAPEPSAEPTPIPIQETTITPEATQP